ncbi:MAG: flavin reductase family protein [Chitinophagaceae bacterium]|nr:flavin reductase family protein [Chitinophagaceae bacterium]
MILKTTELSIAETQYFLQHIIAPRPVCLASTVDAQGNVNLSPFSFFNLFSSNPPIVIFSPARRVRDNTTKHTLENVKEVPEVVVNIVTYDMVHQVSLASCEYPKHIDEFKKAGFTSEPALMVKPPMVKEAKAKLECRVVEIKSLGENGGAGQLVIAEVVCIHINDELLTADKKFDQAKLELVARLGGDWYARISPENLFKVEKPNTKTGIGIDALPEQIKSSAILTGNHLAQLANVHEFPAIDPEFNDPRYDALNFYFQNGNKTERIHHYLKELIDEGKISDAWQVLLKNN